jgi:hypothetical protein
MDAHAHYGGNEAACEEKASCHHLFLTPQLFLDHDDGDCQRGYRAEQP